MAQSVFDDWFARNKKVAESWQAPPKMAQLAAVVRAPELDGKRVAILTCMDPRCIPEKFFNLGPEAPVIRVAGGRAIEAIRSLTTLHALLKLDNVMVIHHTDCGLSTSTDEQIRSAEIESNPAAKALFDKMEWHTFTDVDQSVRDDVNYLQEHPALKGMSVTGWSLDTFTGVVTPVH